jgi:AraC-like DNA-binding protein
MARSGSYTLDANIRTVLRDVGIDAPALLRRAHLPDDLFAGGQVQLASAEYYRLWRVLEDAVGDPAFPIVLAGALTTESFSPPIFAAMCSPDFVTAVGRISRFKPLIAPIDLVVEERPAALRLTLEWWEREPEPPRSLMFTELAFFVALIRIATREHIVPMSATIADAEPVPEQFREYFGIAIESGPDVAITFAERDVRRTFLTANERMWDTFAPELRRRLADLDAGASVSERVAAVLLEHLPSGLVSMDDVAKRLIMSRRTLQRRLRDEGTSFQVILRDVRHDLALHYLTESELTATEISYLIGFEDANSFFRAFHDWTGSTPHAIRATAV